MAIIIAPQTPAPPEIRSLWIKLKPARLLAKNSIGPYTLFGLLSQHEPPYRALCLACRASFEKWVTGQLHSCPHSVEFRVFVGRPIPQGHRVLKSKSLDLQIASSQSLPSGNGSTLPEKIQTLIDENARLRGDLAAAEELLDEQIMRALTAV